MHSTYIRLVSPLPLLVFLDGKIVIVADKELYAVFALMHVEASFFLQL
jgi:hypothetical protein